MGRMIDADVLVEYIQEKSWRARQNDDWSCVNCADDIEDFVTKMPTINQWIPITERLPEEDGWYNVTKNTRGAYFVMECWFALNGGWECNDRDTITAWTTVLKPYIGSEEK